MDTVILCFSMKRLTFPFNFFKLILHRTQTRACKDHLASPDVTESMDITGYQALKAEMELKVKREWQVPLDHVVRREK